MTLQSGTRSDKDRTISLPIEKPSLGTMRQLLPQTALELKARMEDTKQLRERAENLEKNLISAIDSMERMDAASPPKNADTSTFAKNASNVDMEKWTAKSRRQCEELGKRPRYLRHNVYRDDELVSRSCAKWTEIARPLTTIPKSELNNTFANETINRQAHLFEVSTPINVDNLESLLEHHPNPLFVNSVLNGLQNGFWPWADSHIGDYMDVVDESLGDFLDQNELNFICEQRDKEIRMGRFSDSFGEKLFVKSILGQTGRMDRVTNMRL